MVETSSSKIDSKSKNMEETLDITGLRRSERLAHQTQAKTTIQTYCETPKRSILATNTDVPIELPNIKRGQKNEITLNGKRVVDFNFIFLQLKSILDHGTQFGCTIENLNIVNEVRYGLNSKIFFECAMCNRMVHLYTCEKNEDVKTTTVNVNVVAGSTLSGLGYTQTKRVLESGDIPFFSHVTFQNIEENQGLNWKNLALKTMKDAAKEEKRIAIECGNITQNGTPLVTVITDGCWSRRSYGTNYSALSGSACIIGEKTRKVLYYDVRNKYCHICQLQKDERRKHKCNINFTESSTKMESDIIVQGFKNSLPDYGIIYNQFVADGDSSVFKRLLEANPYENIQISKIECKNHLYRNFRRKLSSLAANTKFPIQFRKKLLQNINRMIIGIKSAVNHWKTSTLTFAEKISHIAKNVLNVPYHIFGDHKNCNIYYCKRNNEQNLVPLMILCGLFEEITTIVHRLVENSKSLLLNMDSNVCEQFNSVICQYVGGKRINFSLSQSYTYRCATAVVQFNTGKAFSAYVKMIQHEEETPKTLLTRSEKKILNKKSKTKKNLHRRMHQQKQTTDIHYGADTCEKPDMLPETLKIKMQHIKQKLRENFDNRRDIQIITQEQSESSYWQEIRKYMVTASDFGKICKVRSDASYHNIIKNKLYCIPHAKQIFYGKIHEKDALSKLEEQTNGTINKCGLFIDEELHFLGATPDGLIGSEGICEVKCPYSAKDVSIEEAIDTKKIKYLKYNKEENCIELKKSHHYFYQIQGQLHITKKEFCIFAVWTTIDFKFIRIERDENFFITKMKKKLEHFYYNFLLFEICDPRIPRNMRVRNT